MNIYLKVLLPEAFFQRKMHQIAFGGRAPPGPAGSLQRSLRRPIVGLRRTYLLLLREVETGRPSTQAVNSGSQEKRREERRRERGGKGEGGERERGEGEGNGEERGGRVSEPPFMDPRYAHV